ncbi:hypothetical protein K2X05_05905, partial [bacterium]|nr:hypothetical protein [bacterium]
NGFLEISSADIYNFLSTIVVTDQNQFDFIRIKNNALTLVEETGSRKRLSIAREHYQSIVQLIKNL